MRLQNVCTCKHGCDVLDLLVFFENYAIEVMGALFPCLHSLVLCFDEDMLTQ